MTTLPPKPVIKVPQSNVKALLAVLATMEPIDEDLGEIADLPPDDVDPFAAVTDDAEEVQP